MAAKDKTHTAGTKINQKLDRIIEDLDEIGARVATIEENIDQTNNWFFVRNELKRLEKRYTSLQGKIDKLTPTVTAKPPTK